MSLSLSGKGKAKVCCEYSLKPPSSSSSLAVLRPRTNRSIYTTRDLGCYRGGRRTLTKGSILFRKLISFRVLCAEHLLSSGSSIVNSYVGVSPASNRCFNTDHASQPSNSGILLRFGSGICRPSMSLDEGRRPHCELHLVECEVPFTTI